MITLVMATFSISCVSTGSPPLFWLLRLNFTCPHAISSFMLPSDPKIVDRRAAVLLVGGKVPAYFCKL